MKIKNKAKYFRILYLRNSWTKGLPALYEEEHMYINIQWYTSYWNNIDSFYENISMMIILI